MNCPGCGHPAVEHNNSLGCIDPNDKHDGCLCSLRYRDIVDAA